MIRRLRSYIFNLLIVLAVFYPVTASAADLRGIAITARDNVTGTNREVKLYRQMHAVIIGIDKYQNLSPDQQLSYAVKDAKGIEDVLREQYSFDNIYTLYNEQATKSGIMAVLQGKLSNIHEDDAVFIFFAGHGTTQKDKLKGGELGYILPYDGTFSKDTMYINISMTQLKDEVANVIPAKHVFYVIDACYSGTLLAQRSGGATPEHDYAYLQEVTKEPVRQVLTAGTDKQTVLDGGPKGHSVFTGRLIEKLEETDDYITAAELGEYVKRLVHSDALARNHNQTPVSGAFYGVGDFVFVPSAQKRALEIEKENKYLEAELAKLAEQEKTMQATKVKQEREELERQKKALETKQKIEELRQTKIAEAKKREEEQIQKEIEAKKQSGEKQKQEEARLAHLKMQVEKKRQMLPEVSAGELSAYEAIIRIKKLKAELSEIDVKISEAVKHVGLDYARQLREADATPRDEYETSADYQKRVAAADKKKKEILAAQTQAEESVRTQFSTGIETEIENLLKAEYPVPSKELSFTLGQYDADAGEMPLQILWTLYGEEYKGTVYLKIDGKDARLLKEHKEFLLVKGWAIISESLQQLSLSKIEVIDDADNQRSIKGRTEIHGFIGRFVSLEEGIMTDITTGLQWAQDAGGQKMSWDKANAYVQEFKIGGFSDWRLPTKEELEALLTYCKSNGIPVEKGGCAEYYNKIGFKNVQSGGYWSSTSDAYYPSLAWIGGMWSGGMVADDKSGYYDYYVWPVRSGKFSESEASDLKLPYKEDVKEKPVEAPYRNEPLIGTWSGTANQPGHASYPVTMKFDNPEGGKIDFRSLNCGGSLTFLEKKGSTYSFSKQFSYGQHRCVDGGIIHITPNSDGTLDWDWSKSSSSITMKGTLNRQR